MTTRSQKRKAVEELVSTEMETPIAEVNQNLNPVVGSSKSPRVITENLEEIKSSLRKEIMSDLTKILAENQKEMLKLIAAPVKKQTVITTTEETDSESENIPENATSTPIKSKTTATNRKITPVNSRNSLGNVFLLFLDKDGLERCVTCSDFLFLPDHSHTLIRVSKLKQNGAQVIFGQSLSILVDGKATIPFEEHANLYVLKGKTFDLCSFSGQNEEAVLWHHRLGHNYFKNLKCLAHHVSGLSLKHNIAFDKLLPL